MVSHIYLIHEREFIRLGENIFKIGRSGNLVQRIRQYPSGSRLVWAFCTMDALRAEKAAIDVLCQHFKFRLDIGREYLEGRPKEIVSCLHALMLSEIDNYVFEDPFEPAPIVGSKRKRSASYEQHLSCNAATNSLNPETTTSFQNLTSKDTSNDKTSALNLSTSIARSTP